MSSASLTKITKVASYYVSSLLTNLIWIHSDIFVYFRQIVCKRQYFNWYSSLIISCCVRNLVSGCLPFSELLLVCFHTCKCDFVCNFSFPFAQFLADEFGLHHGRFLDMNTNLVLTGFGLFYGFVFLMCYCRMFALIVPMNV